jgi:hypothetical protein
MSPHPWVDSIEAWPRVLRERAEWRNMILGGTWALHWAYHGYDGRWCA